MMDEKRIESAIKEISEETELFKKLLGDDDEWNEVIQLGIDIKKTAIEALEKQLPMMTESAIVEFAYGTFKERICPKCEEILEFGKYCPNCGQRLDWSET